MIFVYLIIQQDIWMHRVSDDRELSYFTEGRKRTIFKDPIFIMLYIISAIILTLTYYSLQTHPTKPPLNSVSSVFFSTPFHSGEVHYSRMPRQYWEHRVQMMKAMGLNALSIYVMWNYHEQSKGVFDFTSQNRDLAAFLALAQKYNMKVLMRPGPYVCAEWDFGGLPARLLGVKGLQIRTNNALYEAEVKIYFKVLAPILKPFLQINGGNIILIQIENELGSFSSNSIHTQNLLKMWKDLGVECEFYIEDASKNWKKHYWPGAHIGISSGQFNTSDYTTILSSPDRANSTTVFGGQIYTGWLTHWGEDEWAGREVDELVEEVRALVFANYSLNLFLAYGGTNFGLTAGANGFPNPKDDYRPTITSYDYGCPIDEQGRPNQKFKELRNIFYLYNKGFSYDIPEPIKAISIPSIQLYKKATLWQNLQAPTLTKSSLTYFESDELKMYNQGIVIYQTTLPLIKEYHFQVVVHDYALFYLDNVLVQIVNRTKMPSYNVTIDCQKPSCHLKVLVEAMGHINYHALQKQDRKGLLSLIERNQTKQKAAKLKWNITKVPIDTEILQWTNSIGEISFPALMKGTFNLQQGGDTFFDMTDYQKGYLWVNDRLLGRYWHIGPQKRLYCPGGWLHEGQNTIAVLQLHTDKPQPITGFQTQGP